MWARPDVVPLQQMEDIFQAERDGDYNYAGLITGKTVKSEAERNKLPITDNFINIGNGFRLAATRGPDGEKIEISYRIAQGNSEVLETWCKNDGVSTLMLRPLTNSIYKRKMSQKMAGFHHISITVDNRDQTVNFYTKVLGGKALLAEAPLPAGSELWYNILFQDDILEKGSDANATYGVLTNMKNKNSSSSLTTDFYFFQNILLETYMFEDAEKNKTFMDQRYKSCGYHRSIIPGFQVKDSIDFNGYIKKVETDAANLDMKHVKANRPVSVNTLGDTTVALTNYSQPISSGPMEGFNYVYFKGPSGEQLSLVQFEGAAKAALLEAMLTYGAVSKTFEETNPWTYEGFKVYCNEINSDVKHCNCKDCSSSGTTSTKLSLAMLMPTLFLYFVAN